jgi:Tol biopolymer transport system component
LLLGSASAVAQERPDNGAVAFAAKRAAKPVIYLRGPDGGRPRLVRTRGWAQDPAVSPGGERLAFRRRGRLGSQIWVTYLDGSGLRQLTGGPVDAAPDWGPTADRLVFARGPAGSRDLYTVAADGAALRRLTYSTADDHSPSWSVRGQIAFVRQAESGNAISVIPAAGGVPRRLARGPGQAGSPAWSPTGRTLAFARGRAGRRDLYLTAADGAVTRRLTELPGDESDPAWSPDGRWLAFVHRLRGRQRLYALQVRRRGALRRVSGRGVRPLTSYRAAARSPHWQPAGLDPVVAAAGDIACDPLSPNFGGGLGQGAFCRQRRTSDLLLRMDLAAVLATGDLQYEDGKLWKFEQSFDPSWGRLKHLLRPVPGNHEYEDAGAAGYFDYFNGPGQQSGSAGERGAGYYSFEVGSWHVVALNSQCGRIGGCQARSPQERWLRADLASHPAACTLAFWHYPRFTSGRHSAEGRMRAVWDALYGANVDLVVNGHEHFYERFAPQTPDGAPDPARGIRQITVGTGGKSRFGYIGTAPNSELRENRYHGVLQLALREGRYDWEFLAAQGGRVADAGTGGCH